MEKQKLRFNYGVSERQLRSMMVRARRKDGPSGEILLQMLECRLDNVVFRAGWAPTIPAARQLVSHCHILLNGKRANVVGHHIFDIVPSTNHIDRTATYYLVVKAGKFRFISWASLHRVLFLARRVLNSMIPFYCHFRTEPRILLCI